MSRLLVHFSVASKPGRHGFVNRFRFQHTLSRKPGLSHAGVLKSRKGLETFNSVTFGSCRCIHIVGLAQQQQDGTNQSQQNYSVQTDTSGPQKGHNLICKDHDRFTSRTWRFVSNTRLPRAFFLDLNRVRRYTYVSESPPDIGRNSIDDGFLNSVRPRDRRDKELWKGLRDIRTVEYIGTQDRDISGGDLRKIRDLDRGSNFQTEAALVNFPNRVELASSNQLREAKHRPGKLDLSFSEPFQREYKLFNALPLNLPDQRSFRDDQGHRRMTKLFMQHVYEHLSTTSGLSEERLTTFIREAGLSLNPQSIEKCTDLLTWSWILLANASTAITRLVTFAASQKEADSHVPLWIILQILRAEQINAKSLHLLLSYITQHQQEWVLWHGSASMLLIVRLLRHARLTAPSCYQSITTLFLGFLQIRFTSEEFSTDSRRIVHWCNRILSLVAIPASTNPFRSIPAQQASQLDIVQYMQESKPEIPITREGYRALAKVQLMHAKTKTEKEWAQAKALTWPPFQNQNQMGVSSNHDYSGKRSRVMKVLQRMEETGYCPRGFDMATKILAGWDIDNTPTIQTRTSAYLIQKSKLWEPGSSHDELDAASLIWAARVQATRTVREAWMCFSAYHNATRDLCQSPQVYHAMFQKLLAKSVKYSESGSVPGDGQETFPDSDLQREVVFISENVPSVSELYSRMISRGVRPSGTFLADLLRKASSLEQGLQYIRDAQMAEHTRRVLTEPGLFPDNEIAQVINTVPTRVLRSYINFLTRTPTNGPQQWHHLERAGKAARNGMYHHYTTIMTAKGFLAISKMRDISIWNAYLTGLEHHLHCTRIQGVRALGIRNLWTQVVNALPQIHDNAQCDFKTFGPVAKLALRIQDVNNPVLPLDVSPIILVKRLFIEAATGYLEQDTPPGSAQRLWNGFCRSSEQSLILNSVPTGDNIESMIWVLASDNAGDQITDILDLLYWLNKNQRQIASAGYHISRHNMCAFRVFLEGSWPEALMLTQNGSIPIASASSEQLRDARLQAEVFGWPDDDTVLRYIESKNRRQRLARLYQKFVVNSTSNG